jgi:hypothetical protein
MGTDQETGCRPGLIMYAVAGQRYIIWQRISGRFYDAISGLMYCTEYESGCIGP